MLRSLSNHLLSSQKALPPVALTMSLFLTACASPAPQAEDMSYEDSRQQERAAAADTQESASDTNTSQVTQNVKQETKSVKEKVQPVIEKVAEKAPSKSKIDNAIKVAEPVVATIKEKTQNVIANKATAVDAQIKNAPAKKPEVKKAAPKVAAKVNYGNKFGDFILEKGFDPDNSKSCRLRIGTKQLQRGAVGIQYWVSLQTNELKIFTSSQVDASVSGTGIQVDGGSIYPFTRVDDSTNPILERDITTELAKGKELNIILGFSLVEPNMPAEHIKIQLKNMNNGMAALKACNK